MSAEELLNLFPSLKVFKVNGNDNNLRSYELLTNNGVLEIYLNENLNKVTLKLYVATASGDAIYLNAKLDDIKWAQKTSSNWKRIELKQNNNIIYSIEFTVKEDNEKCVTVLNYLTEIYVEKIDYIDLTNVSLNSQDTVTKKDKTDAVTIKSRGDTVTKKNTDKVFNFLYHTLTFLLTFS